MIVSVKGMLSNGLHRQADTCKTVAQVLQQRNPQGVRRAQDGTNLKKTQKSCTNEDKRKEILKKQDSKMVEKIQRKANPPALLVGM